MPQDSYFRPSVTVDCVVFNWFEARLHLLLIERKNPPFAGHWALPGGFIEPDETLLESARRELLEETQLELHDLTQLGCYGDPGRDPRGRTLTVVYLAFLADAQCQVKGRDDARQACWMAIEDRPDLAFDHQTIVNDALQWLQAQCQGIFPSVTFNLPPNIQPELQTVLNAITGPGKA